LEPADSAAPLSSEAQKGGIVGFLSTTLGKLVVGGVAVLLLAVALGAVAFFFILGGFGEAPDAVIPPPTTGSTNATGAAEPEPAERPAPRLAETFAFRNIFAPTVKPSVPTSDPTGTGTTATTDATGTAVAENTLFLESVDMVDDRAIATFIWNGQTYQLGEGDQIQGTPWEVLDISGSTVVMLYGDSRVTLVVGQGVGK
jgi:hypothetical protein